MMIDKLDKWIKQQRHNEWVNIIFPPIPKVEYPEAPICPPLGKVKDINDYIREAIADEREACAKLCEDRNYVNYVGGGFARLIRERSDD